MIERLTERLHGTLDAEAVRSLREHLTGCPGCRAEAEATERLWTGMGRLAEDVPSERMRARLWATLSAYEADGGDGLLRRLGVAVGGIWPRQPAWQLGLTAVALVVGFLLGGRAAPDSSAEIQALRGELRSMGQTISVALLDHRSAAERLRGVEWSARVASDERVLGALLETVRHDPNVNVRLAAIEALSPLVDRPNVGRELVAALERQDSQIVRVSLATLVLRADVEGAEAAVRDLLAGDQLDEPAREYLQSLMQHSG